MRAQGFSGPPGRGGVLEGVSSLQGAGATRDIRAVMGWCVEEGVLPPRVGGVRSYLSPEGVSR